MRALRVALRSVAAGIVLASLAAAPTQRVTLTLTDANSVPLEKPLAVVGATRSSPAGSNTIVRVVISPAPAVAPTVTFVSDDPASIAIGPEPQLPYDLEPGLLGTRLHLVRPGRATILARVGPPYGVTLRIRAAGYANANLACAIGAWPALAFAADGSLTIARTPADADVYLTVAGDPQRSFCGSFTKPDQSAREIYHFPYGAVRIAEDVPYDAIRAAQWRDEVHENLAGRGVWLARAKSGATIKLSLPYGPLEIATADHEFPPPGPASALRVTTMIAASSLRTFAATIVARDTLVPVPSGAPLIVGFAQRSRYFDSLFDARVVAALSPVPYGPPQPAWSTDGPLGIRADVVAGAAAVTATGIGAGTVTARFGQPIDAHASRRVYAYGTLSLGCNDLSDGFGVAFGADGVARLVDSPQEADFYASSDAAAFRCAPGLRRAPAPMTPGIPPPDPEGTGGWYFPGGGVFFRDGVDFTHVAPGTWRNTAVRVSSAELLAAAREIAGVRSVLVFRTRGGRLVKLLSVPRSVDSFFGFYAVSRRDGTFAY